MVATAAAYLARIVPPAVASAFQSRRRKKTSPRGQVMSLTSTDSPISAPPSSTRVPAMKATWRKKYTPAAAVYGSRARGANSSPMVGGCGVG